MPATLPADVVNRALVNECGLEPIGDLDEASDTARAARLIYWPTVRQLLAAAHWNFARSDIELTIVADISGVLAPNTSLTQPWSYAYEWPVDCVHARWVPGTSQPPLGPAQQWNRPTPFLVANAPYASPATSKWWEVEGHDPESTRFIYSNQAGAHLIYTRLMQYPDAWDPLFEQAVVAYLAARLAMRHPDKKFALQLRRDNKAIAKEALDTARVRDGDEGWTVIDHTPDWIRARTSGGWAWTGFPGLIMPWLPIPFIEDAGGVY